MYIGMIEPLKQETVKYYITLESENMSFRYPREGYYELKN